MFRALLTLSLTSPLLVALNASAYDCSENSTAHEGASTAGVSNYGLVHPFDQALIEHPDSVILNTLKEKFGQNPLLKDWFSKSRVDDVLLLEYQHDPQFLVAFKWAMKGLRGNEILEKVLRYNSDQVLLFSEVWNTCDGSNSGISKPVIKNRPYFGYELEKYSYHQPGEIVDYATPDGKLYQVYITGTSSPVVLEVHGYREIAVPTPFSSLGLANSIYDVYNKISDPKVRTELLKFKASLYSGVRSRLDAFILMASPTACSLLVNRINQNGIEGLSSFFVMGTRNYREQFFEWIYTKLDPPKKKGIAGLFQKKKPDVPLEFSEGPYSEDEMHGIIKRMRQEGESVSNSEGEDGAHYVFHQRRIIFLARDTDVGSHTFFLRSPTPEVAQANPLPTLTSRKIEPIIGNIDPLNFPLHPYAIPSNRIAEIEARLKPAYTMNGSITGFLSESDHWLDIISADDVAVSKRGKTHQQIAYWLSGLLHAKPQKAFFDYHGRRFLLTHHGTTGSQSSPFRDSFAWNDELRIEDYYTGRTLKINGGTPYMIGYYGFYEGNVRWRVSPDEIMNLMDGH